MDALDPITVEVLWTRLISVIDEAALALHRTSFSTVVRESHDYTCMVLAPDGQSVAQATRSIPSFIGTLPMSVRAFLKKYPAETLRPGDVIISNDPWIGTGHLPDLTIAAPIFHGDVLVGFAGAIAHMADIGGRRRAPDNKDIYEEGLQIPILKLYEAGQRNETLNDIIRQNVRVPDEVSGDIHAMVGACQRMGTGITDLLAEYKMADMWGLANRITDLTETAMRRAIEQIPDGTYSSVTRIDSFDSNLPLEMHCRMEVKGDELAVDFAGSSPQNPSPLNSVLGYTQAYSTYALKCVLLPDVPNNEGNFRPISITAPEGSFLNPAYPAAVEARATVGHYCTSAVFNTLAKALPEKVPAESGIPLHGFAMSGWNEDRPFSTIFFFNGGQGARPDQDGISTLSFPTNVSTTPVEVLERGVPVRILDKSFLPGSGGGGMEAEIAATRSAAAERPAKTVLYLTWKNPWVTISRGTYTANMLAMAGLETLGHQDGKRYPDVEINRDLLQQTDLILFGNEPFQFEDEDVQEFQLNHGIGSKPRLEIIDGRTFAWPGRRALQGLRGLTQLAALI